VRIFSTTPTRKTAPMRDERVKASYAHLTGTSMAAPYVTGVAALLWSFEPSLTVAEVKSRILDRSDIIPGLQGKVMAGRRLNVFKTLYGP